MFSNASATIAPLSPAAAFALRLGFALGSARPLGSCRLGRRRTFRAGRKLEGYRQKLGGDGSGGRLARDELERTMRIRFGSRLASFRKKPCSHVNEIPLPPVPSDPPRPPRRSGKAFARVAEHEEDGAVGNDAARGERVRAAHEIEGKTAPVGLIGDRRVREAVAKHHRPRSRAGRITSRTSWARAASYIKSSASLDISPLSGSSTIAKRLADTRASRFAQATSRPRGEAHWRHSGYGLIFPRRHRLRT